MRVVYRLCMLFLLAPSPILAQVVVNGTIANAQGEAVSFATISIKNTTQRVLANEMGFYQITLAQLPATLAVSAIGYATQEVQVNNTDKLNIQLQEENYILEGVEIKAGNKDPAYAIMRKAIALRKKHLNEIDGFSCDVYIKGLQKLVGAPKKFFGRDVQKTLDLDTNRRGILYLSESQSKYAFKRPNYFREEMIASKVAGKNSAFSFNKASDMQINFYKNLALEGTGLSARSFVSPLADNALFYYNYRLLGKTVQNGITINKISVTPRRKNDPCFSGIVYIVDGTWRLKGTNLNLFKTAGINFVDTLNISQQFTNTGTYLVPNGIKFTFNGNVLGFKFEGYYVGIYNNYQVNPKFDKHFFSREIQRIAKSANKKDSIYWLNNRPIPLTEEEKMDYRHKDAIAVLKQSKNYLDSVDRDKNKFSVKKMLITPYKYFNRYNKYTLTYDALSTSIFYNTVEGLAIKYGVSYRKDLANRQYFYLRPEARYGFKNRLLTGSLSGGYFYDALKNAQLYGSFGSTVTDLNPYGSNSLQSNSINSLLFETNLSKFYKKEFASIGTSRELLTGLQADLEINWAQNQMLKNTTAFTLIDRKDRTFTANNPFTPLAETPLFPTHRSFNVSISAKYTFGIQYITRPDGKFYQPASYPTLKAGYRKGLKNILGSHVDYDLVSAEISQQHVRLGLWGYASFLIGAGKFLNQNSVYFPDYKHFWGNSSTVFTPSLSRFRYLDFYIYATNQTYFEGHFEHNFSGFITNKIPLLRRLKLEEYVGINYLNTPHKRNYVEYYFGLQRLIFSVSYGWAYNGNKKIDQGFRISYQF